MLKRCIIAENRKLHASPIWVIFFVLPLISAGYGTFNYLQNLEILTERWYSLWTQHTLFYSMLFFPAMVSAYAAYLWRLEHLGHNWNLIMASPVFEAEQCLMNSGEELDYTGQVLVLDPDVLKEEFWTPQSQLWYACGPHAIGRSIRAICLGDGETAKWNRSDFVGILKDEYLPEWAAARVKELRPQQTGGMKMEGR